MLINLISVRSTSINVKTSFRYFKLILKSWSACCWIIPLPSSSTMSKKSSVYLLSETSSKQSGVTNQNSKLFLLLVFNVGLHIDFNRRLLLALINILFNCKSWFKSCFDASLCIRQMQWVFSMLSIFSAVIVDDFENSRWTDSTGFAIIVNSCNL